VANATKLIAQGSKPVEDAPYTNTSLSYALESFIGNTGKMAASVEDFTGNFGENEQGLKKYLAEVMKPRLPAAGYQEGFEATVVAIKANEAILKGQKIELPKEFFQI